MQVAWKEQKNKTPSVCDWMMPLSDHILNNSRRGDKAA
jgi:hypothetical protein